MCTRQHGTTSLEVFYRENNPVGVKYQPYVEEINIIWNRVYEVKYYFEQL